MPRDVDALGILHNAACSDKRFILSKGCFSRLVYVSQGFLFFNIKKEMGVSIRLGVKKLDF